uniref:ATP-dependent DNA helicase n=1 Tax=Meloidogyne enterolobii TaxID=390850 RepID=A0A6V7VQN5_MELEN|nr:unnamed protein product [Meloidogyne enterolobii]
MVRVKQIFPRDNSESRDMEEASEQTETLREGVQSSLKKRTYSQTKLQMIEINEKTKKIKNTENINLDEITSDCLKISKKQNCQTNVNAIILPKNSSDYLRKADLNNVINVETYRLGEFNKKCSHCPAIHFKEEESKKKGKNEFLECCNYGKLCNLEEMIQEYPKELRFLFHTERENDNFENKALQSKFKKYIRSINSSFSCASLGCMRFKFPGKSIPIFKIQGGVYHSYNIFAKTQELEIPTNGQLYFVDTEESLNFRLNSFSEKLKEEKKEIEQILLFIESYLRENYIYAKSYKMMKTVLEDAEKNRIFPEKIPELTMLFDIKEGSDLRRYNIPRSNEVCAIIWRDANDDIPAANVIVHLKGKKETKTIYPLSPIIEPMCYPLFYPDNYQGWSFALKNLIGKNISLCDFTKYKLFFRNSGKFLPHCYGGKLFQQWCVDQAARIEWDRLNYIKLHQKEICKESYNYIENFLNKKSKTNEIQVKKQIILPSSFTGGPRNLHESFMDAMTIVNEVGRPDIFLTFTCNPKDEDIKKCLIFDQENYDRPDIVARVFRLKIIEFLKEIIVEKIFGKISGFCYTIEYQKRGLPHLHILLTLDSKFKWKDISEIDKYITAEIPDEQEDKDLYDLVTSLMIHGPCGPDFSDAICWNNKTKKCFKKFPKQFCEQTSINENGYPYYKRPNNGRKCIKKDWKTGKTKVMTNQDVVPYNRYLLKRFRAHINIEKVADIKAVKYIYKYIFKGYDAATLRCVTIENGKEKELIYDEAGNYLDARYISPVEACWKILKYPIQDKSHFVNRLPIHLENEQIIYFEENDDSETLIKKSKKKSKLMAYFEFFQENPSCERFLYTEIPKFCTWNSKTQKWQLRKNLYKNKALGRIFPISPSEGEKYYLRFLLLHETGTSFEDLKTYNGIKYKTFAESCLARGLIKNDEEWSFCLKEASNFKLPFALRNMFVSILLYGDPKYPELLFDEFKNNLAEDYLLKYSPNKAYNLALLNINKVLLQDGKNLTNYKIKIPEEIIEEEVIDYVDEMNKGKLLYNTMNDGQKLIFEKIEKKAKNQTNNKLIYIDGPGGTGKSYLLNALYHMIRGYKKTITNMAFSGIAANILKNGRTIHNRFKFPLNINAYSVSNVILGTKESNEILESDFFVIDEASMTPKFLLEAIDKKLKELTKSKILFGGKSIILSGDFRQTLPIKKFAIKTEIIDLTLKKSYLWKYFKQYKLTKNVRARDNIFARQILDIGNGAQNNDFVKIPKKCVLLNKTNLITEIYGDIFENNNFEELQNRMILCPYNDLVDYYNKIALDQFPGKSETYLSIDEVEINQNFPITTEILNSFNAPGFPLHKLELKVNCKVMCLRNINIKEGICNGSILQIIELKKNVIRCIIIGGEKNGTEVFIHRISLITDKEFPVPLKRHQFPIRLAFASTFIKGQGATYKKIGIDWTRQSFSHGQTYVALSRVGSWDQIKVKLNCENYDRQIDNIVWKEII